MKKSIAFLLIFISISIAGQVKTDSIEKDSVVIFKGFFSDKYLSLIDSLIIETRYKSPLSDNYNYVLKGLEALEKAEEKIPTSLLKKRLKHLDNTSPFFIEYNPILENVINS